MKKVSLGGELEILRRAVEAAAGLLGPDTSARLVERRAVLAVLHLAVERLRLLLRVVVGAADPAELLAPHNEIEELGPSDDPDVLLVPRCPSLQRARSSPTSSRRESPPWRPGKRGRRGRR